MRHKSSIAIIEENQKCSIGHVTPITVRVALVYVYKEYLWTWRRSKGCRMLKLLCVLVFPLHPPPTKHHRASSDCGYKEIKENLGVRSRQLFPKVLKTYLDFRNHWRQWFFMILLCFWDNVNQKKLVDKQSTPTQLIINFKSSQIHCIILNLKNIHQKCIIMQYMHDIADLTIHIVYILQLYNQTVEICYILHDYTVCKANKVDQTYKFVPFCCKYMTTYAFYIYVKWKTAFTKIYF